MKKHIIILLFTLTTLTFSTNLDTKLDNFRAQAKVYISEGSYDEGLTELVNFLKHDDRDFDITLTEEEFNEFFLYVENMEERCYLREKIYKILLKKKGINIK